MSVIRQVEIRNFRAIKNLCWTPKPGLNCLIGPGDSGKSTILDAIDLTLGARRSYSFNDADFSNLDTTNPIIIKITIGELPDDLKNIEKYGSFLRGFSLWDDSIIDEPSANTETVLTVQLQVDADLLPDWSLFSDRAAADGLERRLPWKHRELISPARLGTKSHHNLAWGNRSVLNKLSSETLDVSSLLAELGRNTRNSFASQQINDISQVLVDVQAIANRLGVPVGQLSALLDVNGFSISNGAISLHNNDGTPLRQLGTGSTRLITSGLQKAASTSSLLIVDEAEYGLEPYRITKLLNELGSKDTPSTQQVFITTHSPYVLRELQASQLHVVRKLHQTTDPDLSHRIYSLGWGDVQQATLRVCAEAFLSKAVIVCEGKTEIGLVRGIDLYRHDVSSPTILEKGVYCADGGGDSMFQRAQVFRSLGYPTSIFKDSDKADDHAQQAFDMADIDVPIYEWGNGNATEDALFLSCPGSQIRELLDLAVLRKGRESVDAHIKAVSSNTASLDECYNNFQEQHRVYLAKAANKKSWFKDIEPAEFIARNIISPHYKEFDSALTTTLDSLFQWAQKQGLHEQY